METPPGRWQSSKDCSVPLPSSVKDPCWTNSVRRSTDATHTTASVLHPSKRPRQRDLDVPDGHPGPDSAEPVSIPKNSVPQGSRSGCILLFLHDLTGDAHVFHASSR